MKRSNVGGFTLVEMLTVMAVIAILAGLVLAANSGIQYKAAKARAEGEIGAIKSAMEAYKADNGTFPREKETDELDPRMAASPALYKESNLIVYKSLSGDLDRNTVPDKDAKIYYEFKLDVLNCLKDKEGKLMKTENTVLFIQDPWGNPYGYSTANAKQEEEYIAKLKANTEAKAPDRPAKTKGYNPTYDLWSTGGSTSGAIDQKTGMPRDAAKWVKNW